MTVPSQAQGWARSGSISVGAERPDASFLGIVEEHLEELGYLAVRRRGLLFSNRVGPTAVHEIDARTAAQFDALRIAGPASVRIAQSRFDHAEPWQRVAAFQTWLDAGTADAKDVIRHLSGGSDDALDGWREAFRRASSDRVRELVPLDLALDSPRTAPIAIDAWGWHRMLPRSIAASMVHSEYSGIRAAVARAVGCDDRLDRRVLGPLLDDSDPAVAARALWSHVVRGIEDGLPDCRRFLARHPDDPFLIQTLGLVGDSGDVGRMIELVGEPRARSAAIRAIGHLGSVDSVDFLLRLLDSGSDATARAASEAFEAIVGPIPRPRASERPVPIEREPAPLDPEWASNVWSEKRKRANPGAAWWSGWPRTLIRDSARESMVRLWRFAVTGEFDAATALRAEVFDGFYAAEPAWELLPGE